MLANPVVVLPAANPLVWLVAIVAIVIEIAMVLEALREAGWVAERFEYPLVVVQVATWVPFLAALNWVVAHSEGTIWGIAALEVLVFLAEIPLLRAASRGWFGMKGLSGGPIGWVLAVRASLVGNAASLAVSLSAPMGLRWLV